MNHFRRGWLGIALCVLLGVLPARGQSITEDQKRALLTQAEGIVQARAYASGTDFERWKSILESHRAEIDAAANHAEFTRAVNRALKDFGISHIDVLTPQMARQRAEGSITGIGVRVGFDARGIGVERVLPGTPAQAAGLQAGDIITQVDGARPIDSGALRGPEGSSVTIAVQRASERLEKTITRAKISTIEPESLRPLADDAVLIRIPTFGPAYNAQRVEELFAQAATSRYLVLDLTSNGGGAVTNLNHLLGMFLEKDTAFGTSVSRALADKYKAETGGDPSDVVRVAQWSDRKVRVKANPLPVYTGQLAVLLDSGSASASEITAAALHELRGALLAGRPSAGAVLVSTHMTLENGFQIKVPISDYVTIQGRRLEGHPTEPELPTPIDEQAGERALIALRQRDTRAAR